MGETGKISVYNILYSVSTGISICNQKNDCPISILTFNFKDHSIFVKDYKFSKDGKILDYGLEFIAQINTKNLQQSLNGLENDIEMLLNLLCFSTLCYADKSSLNSIVKINDSSEEHEVSFYLYPVADKRVNQLCIVDRDFFAQILGNYNKCDTDEKRRILRAITWLRKGLNDEKLDEFISNWIGLEILSKIIRKKYLGTVSKNDKWGGLKKIFNDYMSVDETRFEKDKNDYRDGIVHGFKDLNDEYIHEVEEFTPLLRKGLIASICKSLNLSDKIINQLLKRDLKKWRYFPYEIQQGKIKNIPSFEEQKKQFPRFFPLEKGITFEINEENKVTWQIDMMYEPRAPSGTLITKENLETCCDNKSRIEKIDVEIK